MITDNEVLEKMPDISGYTLRHLGSLGTAQFWSYAPADEDDVRDAFIAVYAGGQLDVMTTIEAISRYQGLLKEIS